MIDTTKSSENLGWTIIVENPKSHHFKKFCDNLIWATTAKTPCTKSLIFIGKTPIVKYYMYDGRRTLTIGSNLYCGSQTPTLVSNLDEKVGGNLQIVEGTMVTKEYQEL